MKKILPAINLVIILTVIVYLIASSFKQKNIVFIDKIQLFENFNMTSEMKKKGNLILNKRKKELDSLLQIVKQTNDTLVKKNNMQLFIQKQKQLDQFNQQFSRIENEKIWKRIDNYLADFVKKNNYELIIGTQSNSTIMYGEQPRDITSDFLNYINQKYEGQ